MLTKYDLSKKNCPPYCRPVILYDPTLCVFIVNIFCGVHPSIMEPISFSFRFCSIIGLIAFCFVFNVVDTFMIVIDYFCKRYRSTV